MANCAVGADMTRVWDLGVRMFHWLAVAAVAIALVSGLFGPRNLLNIHLAAGAALGGLVVFRMLWGLMGSTYARFSSFPIHLTAINADLAGLVAGRRPRYRGHNPLGSLMALAMITGKKAASATDHAARPAKAKPVLAGLCALILMTGAIRQIVALSARPALGVPVGPLDPIYAQEWGSCHMAYSPSLAPGLRWIAIMDGLSNHFGEDASLEPGPASRIRAILTTNAAEKWDTRAAYELQGSNPQDPLRLTATPFWIRMHRGIPEGVFKSRAVGAKGACGQCHSDASTGRFDPQDIHIPE